MFEQMTTAERVQAAKGKTECVLDHLLYLLALHENNAIVVYSTALASQIARSDAANALKVFQEALYRFEVLRLCALWDRAWPDLSGESIPTIIALIDDANVIEALLEEASATWRPLVDPSEYAKTDDAVRDALVRLNEPMTAGAREGLTNAIATGRKIERSALLVNVRNLRNKRLVHSLSETSRGKNGAALPMTYGDERKLFLDSLSLVEALHRWVNCKTFSFDKSREMAQRDAEALWKHSTFNERTADAGVKALKTLANAIHSELGRHDEIR
jgi:hypothetical protein